MIVETFKATFPMHIGFAENTYNKNDDGNHERVYSGKFIIKQIYAEIKIACFVNGEPMVRNVSKILADPIHHEYK
jgi:hypothetical protein